MVEDCFIERTFTVDGKATSCRFYLPREDKGPYRCLLEIDWPEGAKTLSVCGDDGVQSLLLAMIAAHTQLLVARNIDGRVVSLNTSPVLALPINKAIEDWAAGTDL
jgi:hypothetical protein